MAELSEIFTDEYLDNKENFKQYQDLIVGKLNLVNKEGKLSKWVDYMVAHDIVIAPGEKNIGLYFDEFKKTAVETISSDTRTYDNVPGSFFVKGTELNGKKCTKHIVYLNINYDPKELTSINFFAHELGHAIDHVAGKSAYYFSYEGRFGDAYKEATAFFNSTDLAENIKEYLHLENEAFAECFAFYRSKDIPLNQNDHFKSYFDDTNPQADADKTPHDFLSGRCPKVTGIFKDIAKSI